MIAAVIIAAIAAQQIAEGNDEAWVLMGLAAIYVFFAIVNVVRG